MSPSIVIVGSGFAAYQLVKSLRRQDGDIQITVITINAGDDYHKPDLSHVFSKSQSARQLVKMSGTEFAEQHNIKLLAHARVESIDPAAKTLSCNGERLRYDQLVLATGAQAFIPPIKGRGAESLITLNSLEEFAQSEAQLAEARSVLVIGAGLIGTEIALDLAQSGRQVVLTDRAERLMANQLPKFVSAQLAQTLTEKKVRLELATEITQLEQNAATVTAHFANNQSAMVDAVICAPGLRAQTQLAKAAGLNVERGIVVDRQLRTSSASIYALGDCAQIDDLQLAYLQPAMLSANALAKTLLGQATELKLPPMLVRVKTPQLPIQLSGITNAADAEWKIEGSHSGLCARAFDKEEKLIGFVVTGSATCQAIGLLRQLPPLL